MLTVLETMHKQINTNKKRIFLLSYPNSFKYTRILSINHNWRVIVNPLTTSASWGILGLIGWSLDEKITVSPCWQRPHFFVRTDRRSSTETDRCVTFIWRWRRIDERERRGRWSDQRYQCCQSNLPPSTIWGGSQLSLVCNFQFWLWDPLKDCLDPRPLESAGICSLLYETKIGVIFI